MRIKERDSNYDVEVYGMYWANYRGKTERFHLVIPYEGYEGLITVPESECVVTDPVLSADFILTKGDSQNDVFIHRAAFDDRLIDKLIDHDADAMKIFLERLSKLQNER